MISWIKQPWKRYAQHEKCGSINHVCNGTIQYWSSFDEVTSTELWCLIWNSSWDNSRGKKTLQCNTAWQPRPHVSLIVFSLLNSQEKQGELKFNVWLESIWNTESTDPLSASKERSKLLVCFFIFFWRSSQRAEGPPMSLNCFRRHSPECLQSDRTDTREINTVDS